MIDWDKEDDEVCAVLKYYYSEDTLLKIVDGELFRKDRGNSGWTTTGETLDYYKENFSSHIHIRPKVDWNLTPSRAIKLVKDNGDFFWINSENQWWDEGDNTWNTDNYCVNNIIVSTRENQRESQWTVYNNELPFSELTPEQKGRLMVASLDCHMKFGYHLELIQNIKNTPNWVSDVIYQAIEPQPDMIELFNNDLESIPQNCAYAPHMIEKGWYKRDIEGEEL